ncbi:MAG: ABC transporter substrate-binding protein [Reyranella sp.]|nr:ABC transporter substrate-binding protein [Reyranella sp.]
MRRRSLLGAAMAVGPARSALAQASARRRRLAVVSQADLGDNRYFRALIEELRRLGHIEGSTLTVERFGRDSGASGMVAGLQQAIRAEPDVIYAIAAGSSLKQIQTAIPIVALTADPVGQGIAETLAQPGGNITGVSVDTGPSVHGKRLELLREAFPGLSILGFVTLRVAWETVQGPAMRAAAEAAGIRLVAKLLDPPVSGKSFREAIGEMPRDGANALIVGDHPAALGFRSAIVEAAAEARLPAMYTFPETVEAGGLMAYSFDLIDLNRHVARSIDAVLRGTPPGVIPFYQTSTFTLSINLKTAAAQGIVFPQSILGRADEVIE